MSSIPIKAIELLQPHTHAGRDYEPGNILVLDQVDLDQDSAAWLISIGVGKQAAAPQQ